MKSRLSFKRQGFIEHFLRTGHFADKMSNVVVAKQIASIIAPICKTYSLGSPITGAQCELRYQPSSICEDKISYENDEIIDPFAQQETLILRLYVKSTSSLTRLKQIKGTLENALKRHGFGSITVEGIYNPKAFQPLETPPEKTFIPHPKSKRASDSAKTLARSLKDPELKKALENLSNALKEHQAE